MGLQRHLCKNSLLNKKGGYHWYLSKVESCNGTPPPKGNDARHQLDYDQEE